jgi:LmbE family N-acetylglucosaminyl deacetylase
VPHQGDRVTVLNHGLGMPEWAKNAHARQVRDRATRPRITELPSGGSFVNIVAHSDDDLLFINPDLEPAIKSGLPVRTIVLTADEFNGVPGELTREQLAARLREGARRAYASLAQVTSNWRKETMVVADRVLEVDTLLAAPHVQLIWLSLPDGGDDLHSDALLRLWQPEEPPYVTDTIVPTGGPVTAVQQYDGERLYLVLVGLLDLFQPTTIRIQDPAPDGRHRGDHSDHVAGTAFAQLAVRTYEGPDATGLALLLRYRCYNTSESDPNVPDALLVPKTAAYRQYSALDPLTGNGFDANLARNYQRFPVTAPWAVRDGNGALHAVVVGADDVIAWRQASGASSWTGPTSLVSGSFAPGVAMARNANGLVQLAVLDLDTGEVMTARQTAAGGAFGNWTSLGGPPGDPPYGAPAFGVNSAGGLELYLLDAAGGISNAFQETPNGAITGWYAVGGGPDVMGQPAILTASSGRLHVFADNNGRIAHWIQPPGGNTTSDTGYPVIESVAAPGAAVEGTGKARIITREYTDGALGTSVESTRDGTWTGLTHLGGQGGLGPAAVVLSGGTSPRLLVFVRNDDYGISLSRQAVNGTFGTWQNLGGYCETGPAVVLDASGLVRLLVVGADCRLYQRKQTAAGPDGAFDNWQGVGV